MCVVIIEVFIITIATNMLHRGLDIILNNVYIYIYIYVYGYLLYMLPHNNTLPTRYAFIF